MQTGTIKWFNKDKSFGFIKPDDNSKDIFLHYKELKKINLETTVGFKKLLSYENKLSEKSSVMSLYSAYQNYLARLCMYEKLKKNNKEMLSTIKKKFVTVFEKLIKYEPTFEEMTMPYLIELGLRKPPGN